MELALFDFDGTITRKDTFIEFIKFSVGARRFNAGMMLLSPVLVAYKLKVIPNWRAKEIVFGYFFKGVSKEEFTRLGNAFAANSLPPLIRPSAERCLRDSVKAGHRVVIVTASAEEWISAWSEKLNIEFIGTKWEFRDNMVTGKIDGKNCYGAEKVARIKSAIDLSKFMSISVYGDTSGDREMLQLGTQKYYRYFVD